jgi:hypothetical protein
MQIPETPISIEQLDLMKRLSDYSLGKASWLEYQPEPGQNQKQSCQILHSNIVFLVSGMLAPLLGRINARETETFTMHDSKHSLKVAHLMWHILKPDRRERLTPSEIALLVLSAYLHDLGMALSPKQREERLSPESDLWQHLEIDENLKNSIINLKEQTTDSQLPETKRDRARHKLQQAEEVLLCQDLRERHASRERYEELLIQLQGFHNADPSKLPDVESCLSFDGDSFRDKLIDICVSHGQDLDFLLGNDETNIERPRFPRDYTIGSSIADLHMVAAALRLADILDFDRERTPSVLFYYLLPTTLAPHDDKSLIEWSKHMTISNWQIEEDAVVFRGHCKSHIIHHTVVLFCNDIENEIKSTQDTFLIRKTDFPFNLPKSVQTKIEQHGYTYMPYKFELDDHRVYELLMGGAIYDNPLVATRELVQNAVDACKLRDAQKRLYEPEAIPNTTNRITVRYEEPTDQCQQPKLTTIDTGTGMDKWILENYFLKVGRSYYNSSDFNKIRFQLRTKSEELDFAPISEFGIGFLSCFLISDRLQVTTAMWESIRGDTIKRTLIIDGPTRLIRISEQKNEGLDRFKGTSVTLYLSRGSDENKNKPPRWNEIKEYLKNICLDLPYRLNLEHLSSEGHITKESIDRIPLSVQLPQQFESMAVRIPVDDQESGLEGEIAIISPYLVRKFERNLSEQSPVSIFKQTEQESALLRGGFNIDYVSGLPISYLCALPISKAILRFNWKYDSRLRYPMPNLARNRIANEKIVYKHVVRLWLSYLLSNVDSLPEGLLYYLSVRRWRINSLDLICLEEYDALTVYKLARQGWSLSIGDNSDKLLESWENCTGESCYLGSTRDHLYWELLDTILPKITTLQMAPKAEFYVKPPKSNWRKILGEWRNFITSPVPWGPFVEYIGNIENLLCYEYPGSIQLNSRFRERVLISFNEDESIILFKVLSEIADARSYGRQARLTDDKIALLKRAQKYLGDLEISTIHGSWRIDSFAIPQSY